ncbi:hypothetical protein [Deinococcus arenicola]|uniref:Uncharacterized protein n=1 Tax=Deinococcus arenicola TaxID=2994950 RepID=A0ABU4DQP7_9DEIO|nr:hypothetical protein [Deinococcus sp. ZS9-10]MDV6374756.1 hypothetical protein [Deinococcus sp. ZS9-10]
MSKNFDAFFINGVYEEVLKDIADVQQDAPNQTLYLQPFSKSLIAQFRDSPPTQELPVRILASTTDNLSQISYAGDVVGWKDKRELSQEEMAEIDKIISVYQPTEGIYESNPKTPPGVNLMLVLRMRKLDNPHNVGDLIKISDGQPLSDHRTRAGGWSYVNIRENVEI